MRYKDEVFSRIDFSICDVLLVLLFSVYDGKRKECRTYSTCPETQVVLFSVIRCVDSGVSVILHLHNSCSVEVR